MAISTDVANKILDALILGSNSLFYSQKWVSLHTGDPGATGASEVVLPGYSRKYSGNAFTVAAASRSISSAGAVGEFTASSGAPVTITHWGAWDSSTAGIFIMGGTLGVSRLFGPTAAANFLAGELTVTI